MKRAGQKTAELSLKSMRAKLLTFSLICLMPFVCQGYVPPPTQSFNRGSVGEDLNSVIKQLRFSISDLKNEIKNHETEIRMFEERLHNQENSNDHMQQQLSEDFQSQKDFSRATLVTLQTKFDQLEQRTTHIETQIENLTLSFSHLMEDIRQNVTKTNESITAFSEQKQYVNNLDKQIQLQNENITNLESALQMVVELVQSQNQPENQPQSIENSVYRVQPGDTLEKIARSKRVTIKQLKDYNQLTSDRINVGQTLKIPQ